MSVTSSLRKALQAKLQAGMKLTDLALAAGVNSHMLSRFLDDDRLPPGVEMIDLLAHYLKLELGAGSRHRPRTPKIADAGEIPQPAKRARQTRGLQARQREAAQRGERAPRGGMKSAGGVAGGVPKLTTGLRRAKSR